MARFLVDQQLPRALAYRLIDLGHDARHIEVEVNRQGIAVHDPD